MRNLLFILCCLLSLSVAGQDDLNYDGNNDGCVNYEDVLNILTEYGQCEDSSIFECGETIAHHDYDYSTVQIGEQCWFSENCRYLPVVSPSSEGSYNDPYYYVFDYEGTDVTAAQATSNYATYGVLYNWAAVMTEGICPTGWHVPSEGEFTQLADFLGGASVAGYAMKSTSGWDDSDGNSGNGSNSSGFNGLPGGLRTTMGVLQGPGFNGYWWSATEVDTYAWMHRLINAADILGCSDYYRHSGMSARCVRD